MPVREVDTHNLSTLMADGANKCVHLLARSPGMWISVSGRKVTDWSDNVCPSFFYLTPHCS